MLINEIIETKKVWNYIVNNFFYIIKLWKKY